MPSATQKLHRFLAACRGNWRNTIYIPADDHAMLPGYLMAADRDGCPVIMGVSRFTALAGEVIDPAECRGKLSQGAFEDIYAQYLLWALPSAEVDVLKELCRQE